MKKIICIAFLLFNCSNAISDNKKTHGLGVPLTSNEMNAISKIKEMVLEFIGKSRTIEPPFLVVSNDLYFAISKDGCLEYSMLAKRKEDAWILSRFSENWGIL